MAASSCGTTADSSRCTCAAKSCACHPGAEGRKGLLICRPCSCTPSQGHAAVSGAVLWLQAASAEIKHRAAAILHSVQPCLVGLLHCRRQRPPVPLPPARQYLRRPRADSSQCMLARVMTGTLATARCVLAPAVLCTLSPAAHAQSMQHGKRDSERCALAAESRTLALVMTICHNLPPRYQPPEPPVPPGLQQPAPAPGRPSPPALVAARRPPPACRGGA